MDAVNVTVLKCVGPFSQWSVNTAPGCDSVQKEGSISGTGTGTSTGGQARHLDTALEQEPWHGEPLFLIQRLTENDDLLEEEDPPLSAARQEPRVLVRDQERVL